MELQISIIADLNYRRSSQYISIEPQITTKHRRSV